MTLFNELQGISLQIFLHNHIFAGFLDVSTQHLLGHLFQRILWRSPQLLAGFFVFTFTLPYDVDIGGLKRKRRKVAHGHRLTCSQHTVFRGVLLEHEVHAFDVIALGLEVDQVGLLLQAQRDPCHCPGDLARHERSAAARALVFEKDAVRGMNAVGHAVVDRDPVRAALRYAVGAAWVEGHRFIKSRRLCNWRSARSSI